MNPFNWNSVTFSKATVEAITTNPTDCRLLRGNENLFSKVEDLDSTEPDKKESAIKQVKEEVRALSAQWLKMQNVCALMGAGASRYVTGFVGSEMYGRIKKIIEKRESQKHITEIEKYSSDVSNIGKDFETFLSQLVSIDKLIRNGNKPLDKLEIDIKNAKLEKNDFSKLILDIERAITVLCNVVPTSDTAEEPTPHDVFVSKLVARDPQQGRGKIFTTNYDTLIERALDRMGIEYLDGFIGTVKRRFDPSVYDLDFYYPGEISEGRVRRYDKVLHLYKIHGSINWRRVTPNFGNPYGISYSSTRIPLESEALEKPALIDSILTDEQLSILPTSGKYGESITMPYAHLFRSFAQALKSPQTVCFVIGYSGWDSHVNQIIEDALTNPGFVCIIVNPSLTDWSKELLKADCCGRVYAFEGEWGKFEWFATEVLPNVEIMKTDMAIAKTFRELQKYRIDKEKE